VFLVLTLFECCGLEASKKVVVEKGETGKKRHFEDLKGRRKGGDRVKQRFRIGTVRRNKRYSILFSLFNLRLDLPASLFRPTSHPPGDDAPTRSARRFRRRGGRGHARGCEDERATFSYQWFYDRILPPSGTAASVVAAAATTAGSP